MCYVITYKNNDGKTQIIKVYNYNDLLKRKKTLILSKNEILRVTKEDLYGNIIEDITNSVNSTNNLLLMLLIIIPFAIISPVLTILIVAIISIGVLIIGMLGNNK